jgi:hypothetical protein
MAASRASFGRSKSVKTTGVTDNWRPQVVLLIALLVIVGIIVVVVAYAHFVSRLF